MKVESYEDQIMCNKCKWIGKVKECTGKELERAEDGVPYGFACQKCGTLLVTEGWLGFSQSEDATVIRQDHPLGEH